MELIVDNFAGGGGASTGIEMALGRSPDIAVNHDPIALAMHELNHPRCRHYPEDVFAVDPVEVTYGQPVGLAWFSPDCKHFSKAKGGKPKSKKIRGLAWVMVKWAAAVRPRVMILENVEEFQTWGPLLADGSACPKRKGKTFKNFVARLRNLGYLVDWRELRACDYGAPTIRKRLFLVARCDERPIIWPAPTHGHPDSAEVKAGTLLPWRTAAECIDWSIPCPSIFERKKPLADATLRRIARGLKKFVIDAADPFIVPLTHHGADRAYGLNEPMRTVTAAHRGEMALITPMLTEHANASHPRCMPVDEPMRTQCGSVKGGHFALVSAHIAKHYTDKGQRPGSDCNEPLSTITTQDHNALVTAFLARHFGKSVGHGSGEPVGTICAGGQGKTALVTTHLMVNTSGHSGGSMNLPMPTITTGNHIAEVRAFLIKYYGSAQVGVDCREPMHTVTAKDRVGLVTIHGEQYAITDIGMRMLQPHELFAAQGFPSTYRINPIVNGKPATKSAQVKACGNSVCPPVAAALVRANVSDMAMHQFQKAMAL